MAQDETKKLYQNHCQGYISDTYDQRKHIFLSETPPLIVQGLVSHILCPPCRTEVEKATLEMELMNTQPDNPSQPN